MEGPRPLNSPVRTSNNAAGSMTGYLFQARYALLLSLQEARRTPAHSVSIEQFDDVAFVDSEGPFELIQTKHHSNPDKTSDNSVDVWKTISIWVNRVSENPSVAADTRFFFLTTSTAAAESALSKLRRTGDSRDVPGAVRLLVLAAKKSKNQTTEAARRRFLSLDPALRKLLIGNIWVFDKAPNIVDVRDEIVAELQYTAPVERVSVLVEHLEGWWFNRIVIALTDPDQSDIPLAAIRDKVIEIGNNFKVGNLPLDDNIDNMSPVTTLPRDDRKFVRQMNLIRVSKNEMLLSVLDYYRASAQRSRWAREKLLLDGEVDRYDRRLQEAWNRRFIADIADIEEDSGDDTKQRIGKEIYRWACQYERPLRNREELWLSSGSFQILSDNVLVGWHPNYATLLQSQEDEM